MSRRRARIIYSGIVQGVGFRWTAEHIANSLGIKGWVRNCPDSTVEVVCEGKESDISGFMDRIKKEMEQYIRSANVEWQEPTGEFDSFDIVFYYCPN